MADRTSPPSLREALDAGWDVTTVPGVDVEMLVDDIVQHRLGMKPVSGLRQMAADYAYDEDHRLRLSWAAELAEDPTLVDRLEAVLPDAVRAEIAVLVEECRHPHRLLVEQVDAGECSACGERLDGPAIVVDDSGGIAFCGPCIRLAANAIEAGRQ